MTDGKIVHIVDDDLDVRQSLAFLLTAAGHAVRVYESATDFLSALPGITGGCLLTDIRMPGMDGLELQRRLNAMGAGLSVIVMTGHGDVPLAVQAMKAGAIDFLEKPFPDEVLLGAIDQALAVHAKGAGRETEMARARDRLASLTEREKQVLDGLIAGKANKVIAQELGISPRTVEVHRANVMSKMQADSLSQLVRMALLVGGH